MARKESAEAFRKRMEKEDTQYLRRVWETEYRDEWTDEQFRIVGEILRERGEEIALPKLQLLESLFITTTPIVQDKTISQYLGIVSSVVVMGTGFLSEFGAGIADLLGTRAGKFQNKLSRAREIALQEMGEQAIQRGGDGIIGVDFDYMTLAANMLMVSANGTVVKFASEEVVEESIQGAV